LSDRDSKHHPFLNSEDHVVDSVMMITESMLLVDLTFTAHHGLIRVDSEVEEIVMKLNGSEMQLGGHVEEANKVLARFLPRQSQFSWN
jgi:hypothetical protein